MRKTNAENETVRDYRAKTQSTQPSEINPYNANTTDCVVINSFPVAVKEYNNRRVVTFKDIDAVHGRPEGTASRNFRNNREHFIEGDDFYSLELTTDEIRRQFGAGKNAGKTMILVTESGYLMLVKSFTDDLAWKVQRDLVNTYFNVRKMIPMTQGLVDIVQNLQSEIASMKKMLEVKPTQPNFWLWKKRIVRPAIDNLVKFLNVDTRTAYDIVYDHMSIAYGFDKSFAMSQFCTKYHLDSNIDSVAIIDAIADSPEYQMEFIEVIHKLTNVSKIAVVENSTMPVSVPVVNITSDKVHKAILPLIHKYNDTSANGSLIYKRVYNAMNKSNKTWANMKTRYHCKSKKAVLLKCDSYYKEFVNTVNQLLSESEMAPT